MKSFIFTCLFINQCFMIEIGFGTRISWIEYMKFYVSALVIIQSVVKVLYSFLQMSHIWRFGILLTLCSGIT